MWDWFHRRHREHHRDRDRGPTLGGGACVSDTVAGPAIAELIVEAIMRAPRLVPSIEFVEAATLPVVLIL